MNTNNESSETDLIFEKILGGGLIVNNANVALLQEYISSWTKKELLKGRFYEFLQNWLKKVHLLHQQNSLNRGACIVTIFILEVSLNEIKLDQNAEFYSLFSQLFVPFHKLIVSACMTDANEVTSSNDAVIAFFRLHCYLSRREKGLELVRKFNLWKQLLSFYFSSNKFNLFIQNSCTEYIHNLISAGLPDDLISFLEVLNLSIQCIKNATENQDSYCSGALIRSLRIVHSILSEHLSNLDANSLRIISKQCLPLQSYIRHLLVTSKDEIIVSYSLKIFVFLGIFFRNAEDLANEDEILERFVTTAYELLKENEKFNRYMPEIFNVELENEKRQSKLGMFSAYLQMRTVAEYLTQLNVVSPELMLEIDSLLPDSEVFANFFQLYHAQLLAQNQISTIATSILKNFHRKKKSSNEKTEIYFIRTLGSLLEIFANNVRNPSEELSNLLLNVIHAISTLITKEAEFSQHDGLSSKLLRTSLRTVQSTCQYSLVIRLSTFKLCSLVLQKTSITSEENINLLKAVVIEGLNDSCWEVRDSTLEVLNEILKGSNYEFILVDREISKLLLSKLEDEESFVRAISYVAITASISLQLRSTSEIYFDYSSLFKIIILRFQNETEGDVREKMIEFIIEVWHSFRIPEELLPLAYETIYKSSTNDLHLEVRRRGMLFWKNLVELLERDNAGQNDSVHFFEKLGHCGCLQAIVSGIEDEYDLEVENTAREALEILKSINVTVIDFFEFGNDDVGVPVDEHLPNRLTSISLEKSDLLSARQFISKYITANSDSVVLDQPAHGSEFDLSDLMECFADSNLQIGEMNQMDCY